MAKALVVYHSRSGNTETLANWITEAVTAESIEVVCKKVQDTKIDELLDIDGLIIGSPTYYGTMAAEIKAFLDASIKHHDRLDGKVGAAFSTADTTGQETTVISIIEALLIHGMVVRGDSQGHHYGVTSLGLGKPNEQDKLRCQRFGQRFARTVKNMKGE